MKIKILIVLSFYIFIFSCKNEPQNKNSEYIKEKIATKFYFPSDTEVIYANNYVYDSIFVFNSPIKIVTFIDFGCSYCYKELADYNKLLELFNHKNVNLIIYGMNLSGIYAFLEEKQNFKYPIFLDKKGEYFKLNNISYDNKILQTFLVYNNKIHLIGNPFADTSIKKLYISEIKKMLNNL